MKNDSTYEKSLIKEPDARAIINLMMSCYKAGLKDAEEICDKYTCEDFKKQGYTLVLRKAATWYVGDIDDITADVVKGLNARYNKVDTKK